MAQEPSSKELLDAVKKQESGGRRYKADGKTLLEGPMTKYGTAKGEMQVLDSTMRDPGYGVKPAKDDSPDERARVGRDILEAFVKKYKDRNIALVAYNWGPGNTDKWLKKGGDFAKLPEETRNYVAKITGSLGTTKVAQATTKPKSGIQRAVYKAAPLTHPMLSQLGPSFQAAMAVSMLADEGEKEGKSEDEPSESEKMLTETTARPVALAQADLGFQSPFPETQKPQQPIKMAAGGVPYVPIAFVSPTAKKQLENIKSEWDAYNTKATSYNDELTKYSALVDAYNAGPRTTDFTGKEPTAPIQPTTSVERYQALADSAKKSAANRNLALGVVSDPERYGLSINKFFADGGVVHRAGGSPETGERMTPQQIEQIAADQVALNTYYQPKARPSTGMNRNITYRSGEDTGAFLQGMTELPYDLIGAPRDISNMIMAPFGYSVENPVMGSAWLKEQATAAGIRPPPPTNPTLRAFYGAGELGAGLMNPAGVVRKGVQVAEAGTASVKKAANMLKQMPQTVPAVPVAPAVSSPVANPPFQIRPMEPPVAPVQQAEPLLPPPAEVAVPQEMLPPPPAMTALPETPPVAPPMQVGVPADRPFVGRLDAFVDTIKNPVQLGQLKGQLKGKFRDYDLERVERAFAGMDDKTKLTPDQIKQALGGVHSPGKWVSETLPPQQGKFHQQTDNVWGKELGTTNLYLEQPAERLAATKLLDEGQSSITAFLANSPSMPTVQKLEGTRKLLNDPQIEQIAGPELVNNLRLKFDKAENNIKLIDEFQNEIKQIEYGFTDPGMYKNAQGTRPWYEIKDQYLKDKKDALQQQFIQQGSSPTAAYIAAIQGTNTDIAFQEAGVYASKRVQEMAVERARSHGISAPNFSLIDWNDPNLRPMSITNKEFGESVKSVLEPSVQTVHEAAKNVQRFLGDDVKELGQKLMSVAAYRGKHKAVAAGPYPVGFTRFSEHEATIPGMGTLEGRHFHELQSDLSKDMRAKGHTHGNLAKDQTELNRLRAEFKQLQDAAFEDLQKLQQERIAGTVDDATSAQRNSKIRNSLEDKTKILEQRISVLGSRTRSNAPYSLEEPFAGFETNQMVRQQLLMKNAIQAAMRDGKRFATFPGNESDKPQLYAGKVLPNLKQVIKDLGGEKSGLELRQIELPPDKNGRPITATGIVWSPEAAARIVEKGVPFAKGGMVERQSADTRRYL